jgi:hypothetical protein
MKNSGLLGVSEKSQHARRSIVVIILLASPLLFAVTIGSVVYNGFCNTSQLAIDAQTSIVANPDVRIDFDRSNIFAQPSYIGRTTTCYPAAVINSLQFGNKELKSVYSKLDGVMPKDKFFSLISEFGSISSSKSGQPVFSDVVVQVGEGGPFYENVLKHFRVRKPTHLFLIKRDQESTRQHLLRIHEYLRSSIVNGFPPVVGIILHKNSGIAMASHSVVIVRVPERITDAQQGFVFDYIEPDGGSIQQGYASIETSQPFRSVVESQPVFQDVGSPYLTVVVPAAILWNGSLDEKLRTFVTLHYLIGDFVDF